MKTKDQKSKFKNQSAKPVAEALEATKKEEQKIKIESGRNACVYAKL